MQIPRHGQTKEEILDKLAQFKGQDLPWRAGRVFAYVYDAGKEADDVTKAAYLLFLGENGLDPTAFPSMVGLETQIVRMVADLLRGDANVVGNFTSGGTESILLAVKTARDYARARRPELTRPRMILPRTAHCAFHKAAAYFDIEPVVTPFDPKTFQADVAAMRAAIDERTILLVGSAPGYAQGVVDPIAEIGRLALERNLLFHVDGCVGGLQLSFQRKMGGYEVPDFDFSVPGVTSISADLHKYGYAAKGASVILYRDRSIRRHQIFACALPATYALVNTTVQSTKSGGPMAGAWAIMHYLGQEGYERITRDVMAATAALIKGIDATGELFVLGKPHMSMFSFAARSINVYQLADEMNARGWYVQPQFSTVDSPPNLHISMNQGTIAHVETFLGDLRASLDAVKRAPRIDFAQVKRDVDELLATAGDRAFEQLAALSGLQGGQLPKEMAMINTVLDCLPDELTAQMLVEFMNDLYV